MLYNWMHFRSLNPPRDYTAATRESIQHLLDQWLILTWKERAAWLNGLCYGSSSLSCCNGQHLMQVQGQIPWWCTLAPTPWVAVIHRSSAGGVQHSSVAWRADPMFFCPLLLLDSDRSVYHEPIYEVFSSHFSIWRLLLVLVTVLLGFCTKSEPCTASGNKKLKLQDICIL